MKVCRTCTNPFSIWTKVQGKRRNLRNRTQCLVCLPFGQSHYRKKTIEEKRASGSAKVSKWMAACREELGSDPVQLVRKDRKKQVVNRLGGGCMVCGYSKCISNLTFHHTRDKKFDLSERRFQFSWDRILPEILKCVLLCHNCHGEHHQGLISPDQLSELNLRVSTLLSGFSLLRLSVVDLRLRKAAGDLKENGPLYVSPKVSQHPCSYCGKPILATRKYCNQKCAHAASEHASWPSNLRELVASSSAQAVARTLGVSGRAVAKRLLRQR